MYYVTILWILSHWSRTTGINNINICCCSSLSSTCKVKNDISVTGLLIQRFYNINSVLKQNLMSCLRSLAMVLFWCLLTVVSQNHERSQPLVISPVKLHSESTCSSSLAARTVGLSTSMMIRIAVIVGPNPSSLWWISLHPVRTWCSTPPRSCWQFPPTALRKLSNW